MATATYETIPYQPGLTIANVAQLPRGRGARYLEVIRSHVAGEFIAKRWRRVPMPGLLLIDFKPDWKTGLAVLGLEPLDA